MIELYFHTAIQCAHYLSLLFFSVLSVGGGGEFTNVLKWGRWVNGLSCKELGLLSDSYWLHLEEKGVGPNLCSFKTRH